MASQLDIWNNALSEIAADRINSVDEASLGAVECRRIWPGLVQEFLAWADWECQRVRVTLAAQANDRTGEWMYRYAKPGDLAEIGIIVPSYDTSLDFGFPAGPFTTPPINALGRLPYELSDTSIYCNVANASAQYISTELQVGRILPVARRAVELELASRIAMPIKKSRDLKGDLIKQAELFRQRAIAHQRNREYSYAPNYVSAAEYARAGYEDVGVGL